MKASLFTAALMALGLTGSGARTWTSADGAKTFEGDLRSYDEATGMVSVVVDGRLMRFPQEKLSAEDIAFLKESGGNPGGVSAATPDTETVVGAKVAKARLHRIDGKRYKRAELEKAPEYYILYFSASW